MTATSPHRLACDQLRAYTQARGLIASTEFRIPQPGTRPLRADLYIHGCAHDPALVVEYKSRLTSRSDLKHARRQVAHYANQIALVHGLAAVAMVVADEIAFDAAGMAATTDEFRGLLDRRCASCSLFDAVFAGHWAPERVA